MQTKFDDKALGLLELPGILASVSSTGMSPMPFPAGVAGIARSKVVEDFGSTLLRTLDFVFYGAGKHLIENGLPSMLILRDSNRPNLVLMAWYAGGAWTATVSELSAGRTFDIGSMLRLAHILGRMTGRENMWACVLGTRMVIPDESIRRINIGSLTTRVEDN